MLARIRLTTLGIAVLATPAVAQVLPASSPLPARGPAPYQVPNEPRLLPPLSPTPAVPPTNAVGPTPQERNTPQPDLTVRLPLAENRVRLDTSAISLRMQYESWQLWLGPQVFRDYGKAARDAQDVLATLRTLRPTEWAAIGSPRTVVEYGLTNGEAPAWAPISRVAIPIDLKTIRAEPVRGAWCVRDDSNILLNFGADRSGAEQAAAVPKRYGFNRLGLIGTPSPAMAFYFAAPASASNRPQEANPFAALNVAAQEASLTRTGVDVPGVGLVGERVMLDRGRLEVRKDRGEWVLAQGPDVLARFGYSEFTARDAQRVVIDARFTEFCRIGGMAFFLVDGKPPTRVPFNAQGPRFDPARLEAKEANGVWGVYENNGRLLFPAASAADADQIIRVVKAYRFDQLCQVGLSAKASMKFLSKQGR